MTEKSKRRLARLFRVKYANEPPRRAECKNKPPRGAEYEGKPHIFRAVSAPQTRPHAPCGIECESKPLQGAEYRGERRKGAGDPRQNAERENERRKGAGDPRQNAERENKRREGAGDPRQNAERENERREGTGDPRQNAESKRRKGAGEPWQTAERENERRKSGIGTPRMKIRIDPGALLFLAALMFTGKQTVFAILLAAAVHECGHLLAARLLGIKLQRMELDLFGAKLLPRGVIRSLSAEWGLAAAGPLFSVLFALILLPFSFRFAVSARLASASFAVFNLLPIAGFDGGRMLFTASARFLPFRIAEMICAACTYLALLFLFCLSACLLLRYGQNLALFVLCAVLFAKIFLPQDSRP